MGTCSMTFLTHSQNLTSDPEEVTNGNLDFVNSKLSAEMLIAIHVTLLCDIIDTFNWFGFNGKIEFVENKNHLLHLYVK